MLRYRISRPQISESIPTRDSSGGSERSDQKTVRSSSSEEMEHPQTGQREMEESESQAEAAQQESDTDDSSAEDLEAPPGEESGGYDEIPDVVAGRIHKPEMPAFWRDVLKADKYILDMLEQGYKLPFREGQLPQPYQEKNNKSAIKHSGLSLIHI